MRYPPCELRALEWAGDLKDDCAEDDETCLAEVEDLKQEALDVCDEEDLCLRRVKHSELRARTKCEDDDEDCLNEVQAMFDEDTRICGLPQCEQIAERVAQKRRADCESDNEDDEDTK